VEGKQLHTQRSFPEAIRAIKNPFREAVKKSDSRTPGSPKQPQTANARSNPSLQGSLPAVAKAFRARIVLRLSVARNDLNSIRWNPVDFLRAVHPAFPPEYEPGEGFAGLELRHHRVAGLRGQVPHGSQGITQFHSRHREGKTQLPQGLIAV
jgi:hypothetical protein